VGPPGPHARPNRTDTLNQRPGEAAETSPRPQTGRKKELQKRLDYMEKKCSEYGRNYDAIVKSYSCNLWIYENEKDFIKYEKEWDRVRKNPDFRPVIKGTQMK
jgi:hypothetical protein